MGSTPTLDRLRAAVAKQTRQPTPKPGSSSDELPPIDRILHGEWHQTADGPVFLREAWFPLDHAHGAFALGDVLNADPSALALLLRSANAPHPEHYAFFDIETTGLSGGAGTWIVLAGLGSFERAAPEIPLAFRLRQYFLAGPQYERAMLQMLADDLARFDAIVTYNGRAFDVPCVESRLTLSRIPSPCGDFEHFDLLHAVRRLYGHRMPGCRLADAERRLLRIERPDDVPGHLVPALYRDYLVEGRASFLRGVLRHNAEDVISLVGILASLTALLSSSDHDPDDAIAVAKWWERVGEWERAMEMYESAIPWLEGSDHWEWAAWRYSLLLRRCGRKREAQGVWQKLWSLGHREAGVELAKYYEHTERVLNSAQDLVVALLTDSVDDERVELSRRLLRIQRKLNTKDNLRRNGHTI